MREAARPTAGPPRTTRPPERALGRPRPSWGRGGAARPRRRFRRARVRPSWGCGTDRPPGTSAGTGGCPPGVRPWPACRPGGRTRLLLAAAAPRRLPALPRRTCAPCAWHRSGRNPGTPGARLAPGQGAPPGRGVSSGVPPGCALPGRASGAPAREEPGTPGARLAPGRGAPPGRDGGSRATRLADASAFAMCFGAVIPGHADGVLAGRCVARGSRPRGRGCEYA